MKGCNVHVCCVAYILCGKRINMHVSMNVYYIHMICMYSDFHNIFEHRQLTLICNADLMDKPGIEYPASSFIRNESNFLSIHWLITRLNPSLKLKVGVVGHERHTLWLANGCSLFAMMHWQLFHWSESLVPDCQNNKQYLLGSYLNTVLTLWYITSLFGQFSWDQRCISNLSYSSLYISSPTLRGLIILMYCATHTYRWKAWLATRLSWLSVQQYTNLCVSNMLHTAINTTKL